MKHIIDQLDGLTENQLMELREAITTKISDIRTAWNLIPGVDAEKVEESVPFIFEAKGKLTAVKFVMETTGLHLKEAKEFVEKIVGF